MPSPEERRAQKTAEMLAIRKPAIIPEHDLGITKPEYRNDEFAGQAILITGVSHENGIGFAAARQFTELGAAGVAINYRVETDETRFLVNRLQQLGKHTGTKVVGLQADIADPKQAEGLVKATVAETGRLDVFVDNAAVRGDDLFMRHPTDRIIKVAMTNIIGPQIIARDAIEQMVRQKPRGGKLIFMGSIAADGSPGQGLYATSKAGKFGLARSLALEYNGRVETFYIAPGLATTTLVEDLQNPEIREGLLDMVGMKKELTPDEVADYVIYAASEHGKKHNGQAIPVLRPME